jgi:hypothetical protein
MRVRGSAHGIICLKECKKGFRHQNILDGTTMVRKWSANGPTRLPLTTQGELLGSDKLLGPSDRMEQLQLHVIRHSKLITEPPDGDCRENPIYRSGLLSFLECRMR